MSVIYGPELIDNIDPVLTVFSLSWRFQELFVRAHCAEIVVFNCCSVCVSVKKGNEQKQEDSRATYL
jgi:hypothetical protein